MAAGKGIEVGSVYVSVIPSVRDFGKATKAAVDRDMAAVGLTASQRTGRNIVDGVEQELKKGRKRTAKATNDLFNYPSANKSVLAGVKQRVAEAGRVAEAASKGQTNAARAAQASAKEAAAAAEAATKRATRAAQTAAKEAAAATAATARAAEAETKRAARALEASVRATLAETDKVSRAARAASRSASSATARTARDVGAAQRAAAALAQSASKEATKFAREAEKAAASGSRFSRVLASMGRNASTSGKSLTQISYGINGIVPALTGAATSMGRFLGEAAAIDPLITAGALAAGVAATAFAAYQLAVGGAAAALAYFGIQGAANLELLRAQSAVLLGSKAGADDYLSFVIALGKVSIVSTDALIRAGRTFAAFGVDSVNNVKALVGQLNNFAAAAGLGVDQVDNLALALAQIYALGKLQGQEVRQLAQVGVNSVKVLQTIPKYAKMSAAQIKEAQAAGEISARDFFQAWEIYTKKYENAAKETNQTVIGLFQQITDTISLGLGQAFLGANGPLGGTKAMLKGLADTLTTVNFSNIATSITVLFTALRNALGLTDPNGLGGIKNFLEFTLPNAIANFSVILSGVIGTIRVFFGELATNFGVITGAFGTLNSEGNAALPVFTALNALGTALGFVFLAVATAIRVVIDGLHGILIAFQTLGRLIGDVVNRDFADIPRALSDVKDQFAAIWSAMATDSYNAGAALVSNFNAANNANGYAAQGAANAYAYMKAFQRGFAGWGSQGSVGVLAPGNPGSKGTPTIPKLTLPSVPGISIPKTKGGGGGSKGTKAAPSFTDTIDVTIGRTAKQIAKDAAQFMASVSKKGITAGSALYKALVRDTVQLARYATRRDAITSKLAREQKILADLKQKYDDLASSIRNSITSYASVGQALIPGINTAKGFLSRLRALSSNAKAFAKSLAALKKAGASNALIEQVAMAGVDEGRKIAETLLSGGSSSIKEANGLVADVASLANTTATTLATSLYGAGISAAQGLIKGLQSQEAALTKQMTKLADAMVAAVKKKLGIKSPSRVMAQVGGYTVDGFVRGIEAGQPRAAAAMAGLGSFGGVDLAGVSIANGGVVVYIGDEKLNARIDYRVERVTGAQATGSTTRARI